MDFHASNYWIIWFIPLEDSPTSKEGLQSQNLDPKLRKAISWTYACYTKLSEILCRFQKRLEVGVENEAKTKKI